MANEYVEEASEEEEEENFGNDALIKYD